MAKVIVLDVGGTSIKYGIITDKYIITYSNSVLTRKELIYHQVEKIIESIMREFKGRYLAIAICSTGIVDSNKKKIIKTNETFRLYENTKFGALESRFKLPVVLENDSNAAAYAHTTKGDTSRFATITFGTGVGVGIVDNKKIERGRNFLNGEIGYTIINDQTADEALSFVNFNKKIEEKFGITSKNVEEFSDKYINDQNFKEAVNNYLDTVAIFTLNLIIFQNLDKVIISGGITHISQEAKNYFLNLLYKKLESTPFQTVIYFSKFNNDAGMIGVAKMFFTNLHDKKQEKY